MGRYWNHELKVVNTPLDEIERHPENANQGDVDALEESVAVNGFYQPVIVQASTGYIIAGNHRWEVARKMGAESIPAIFLDVDDEQARRMMVADNRITRLGSDDPSQLLDLLDSLAGTDYGLLGTGFDSATLQRLLDEAEEPLQFDPEPEPEPDARGSDPWFIDPGDMSDEGELLTVKVSRRDGQVLTEHDYNAIRLALGLNKLSVGVLAQYGITGWN